MKVTLNPAFYSKKRELTCIKCGAKVIFTFSQLGKTIQCPKCGVLIELKDNITSHVKEL